MEINDAYCIKIKRFGALGLEEEAGRLHLHAVERSEVESWLGITMRTLGPGDRAEITLTRGFQTEESAQAAREFTQEDAELLNAGTGFKTPRVGGVHPPLPADDHPKL